MKRLAAAFPRSWSGVARITVATLLLTVAAVPGSTYAQSSDAKKGQAQDDDDDRAIAVYSQVVKEKEPEKAKAEAAKDADSADDNGASALLGLGAKALEAAIAKATDPGEDQGEDEGDDRDRRPTLQELAVQNPDLRAVVQLPPAERVQPLIKSATDTASRGDLESAATRYGLAIENARESGDADLEVEASLRYADLLARQAKTAPADETTKAYGTDPATAAAPTDETQRLAKERRASDYASAVRLYTEAANRGTAQQSALARNELGNLHLAMGDYSAAADAFRHVDLAVVPEGQRFVYQFNRGRALELAGDANAAWPDYVAALRAEPAFRPAVTAAAQALERDGDADRATELAGLLLDRGQIGATEEVLWPALERWPEPRLFALLARAWAVDPPPTRDDDGDGMMDGLARGTFERLAATAGDDRSARELALTLSLAFDTSVFDHLAREAARAGADPLVELSRKVGDPWRDAGVGAALSELLTTLAARDRRDGRAPAALARTFVAWWIDDHNTRAAADCAAVLLRQPDLDPEGRVMEKLVEGIFASKGAAYAAGDWQNILRMHLLLASIYEEKGEWGSEGDPRSAVFQLSHALRAEQHLRELDPSYTPSPGLHRRLGDAYAALGRQAAERGDADRAAERADRAVGHYLQAADSLAQRARLDDARRQLDTAAGLGLPTSAASRERLADARRRLEMRREAAKLEEELKKLEY